MTLQSLKKLAIASCDSYASRMLNMNQPLNRISILMVNLTAVCTMAGLWSLMACTVWKTSTTPSDFRRSIIILIPQNTPVRPTPPLTTEKVNKGWYTQNGELFNRHRTAFRYATFKLGKNKRAKSRLRGQICMFLCLFLRSSKVPCSTCFDEALTLETTASYSNRNVTTKD